MKINYTRKATSNEKKYTAKVYNDSLKILEAAGLPLAIACAVLTPVLIIIGSINNNISIMVTIVIIIDVFLIPTSILLLFLKPKITLEDKVFELKSILTKEFRGAGKYRRTIYFLGGYEVIIPDHWLNNFLNPPQLINTEILPVKIKNIFSRYSYKFYIVSINNQYKINDEVSLGILKKKNLFIPYFTIFYTIYFFIISILFGYAGLFKKPDNPYPFSKNVLEQNALTISSQEELNQVIKNIPRHVLIKNINGVRTDNNTNIIFYSSSFKNIYEETKNSIITRYNKVNDFLNILPSEFEKIDLDSFDGLNDNHEYHEIKEQYITIKEMSLLLNDIKNPEERMTTRLGLTALLTKIKSEYLDKFIRNETRIYNNMFNDMYKYLPASTYIIQLDGASINSSLEISKNNFSNNDFKNNLDQIEQNLNQEYTFNGILYGNPLALKIINENLIKDYNKKVKTKTFQLIIFFISLFFQLLTGILTLRILVYNYKINQKICESYNNPDSYY